MMVCLCDNAGEGGVVGRSDLYLPQSIRAFRALELPCRFNNM